MRFVVAVTIGLLFVCSAPGQAHAQAAANAAERHAPRDPLWRSAWPTVSWGEGGAALSAGVATAAFAVTPAAEEPRWRGGILFDGAVRGALRLSSPSERGAARAVGDWQYYTAGVLPLLADPLVAWLAHGDSTAAVNIELMALEAFSYAGLLSFVSTRVSERERPDTTECLREQAPGVVCERDTEAFWSGHTSIVAASAGVVCANHQFMALWGSRGADVGACIFAGSAALVTAVSRVMADRHYASDVLLGLGLGLGIGYGVPTALHYGRSRRPLLVAVRPDPLGQGALLSLGGPF